MALPAQTGIPFRAKFLYSFSSLGGEALSYSRGVWLVFYYDEELGLNSILLATVLVAGRVIEAFDDALIGYWSDRTRSRWGRRIPFVVLATPPWALLAFLLFTPPDTGDAGMALYLFLTLELFFLFSTLSGGPYEALLPEIAPRSADRVAIAGIRVYLGAAGAGLGLVAADALKGAFGFQAMALAMAGLALVARYVGLAGVWRRAAQSREPADITFREALRATFANDQFLSFLPSFVFFQIAIQMLLAALPYYVDNVLPEDTWAKVRVLAAAALLAAVATVPAFAAYARRTSKRRAFSTAMLAAAALFPLFAVMGLLPGVSTEVQVLVAVAVMGVPIAGIYLFPAVLTADIIDYDATQTGARREATYYGTQNFVEKLATSLAPGLLLLVLFLGKTRDNPLGIRLVGPAAAVVALAGWFTFRRYDLPDEVEPVVEARPVPAAPLL
ncbi:MAG: MFS transporter [Actinomycetota bacterium]|nr:MFS transporter [Actinomycetota bacterium]